MPQSNPRLGWAYMIAYWMFGAVIGVECRYLRVESLDFNSIVVAILGTLVLRSFTDAAYDNFGRKRDYAAIVTFSIMNGVFETFYFLASYDFGKAWGTPIGGFITYFIYSALIHVNFWEPLAFPDHIRKDAKPFVTHRLPFLLLISILWLYFYERGSILTVCICHTALDLRASYLIGLQSPFDGVIPWQTNANAGWAFAVYYWTIGAYIGVKAGYFDMVFDSVSIESPVLVATVAIVTFVAGYYLHSRYESAGRRRNLPAIVIFALLNGIFETFHFLAWYDLGRQMLASLFQLGETTSIVLGFIVYCRMAAYSDLLFLGPLVMPPHVKPDGKSFLSHGLIPSLLLSIGWLILYERGELASVSFFHVCMGLWSTYVIAFPPPFTSTKTLRD